MTAQPALQRSRLNGHETTPAHRAANPYVSDDIGPLRSLALPEMFSNLLRPSCRKGTAVLRADPFFAACLKIERSSSARPPRASFSRYNLLCLERFDIRTRCTLGTERSFNLADLDIASGMHYASYGLIGYTMKIIRGAARIASSHPLDKSHFRPCLNLMPITSGRSVSAIRIPSVRNSIVKRLRR